MREISYASEGHSSTGLAALRSVCRTAASWCRTHRMFLIIPPSSSSVHDSSSPRTFLFPEVHVVVFVPVVKMLSLPRPSTWHSARVKRSMLESIKVQTYTTWCRDEIFQE